MKRVVARLTGKGGARIVPTPLAKLRLRPASMHRGSASLVAVSLARAPRGRDVLRGLSKT